MAIVFRRMTLKDHAEAVRLWEAAEGVWVSAADSRANARRYLRRNPGLSFVARDKGRLVGAALCGHDGRRGYIYHMAVAPSHRRRGVGRSLAARCLSRLRALGIHKCHLFVHASNPRGKRFWRAIGWTPRPDVLLMSKDTGADR